MATNLQKLPAQIHRLCPFAKSLIVRSSATSAPAAASPSSSPGSEKGSDRIVKLFAIDPEGQKREIIGLSGQTLLRALTHTGLIDPASHRLGEIEACSAECEEKPSSWRLRPKDPNPFAFSILSLKP